MLTKEEIIRWLREDDPAKLEELWQRADQVRKENVGEMVHLRGLLEISNACVRKCGYCGLNVTNTEITRYRMAKEEILECAAKARQFGYGTVVMQAGEDPMLTVDLIEDIVAKIKETTGLAVTLSLGERPREELKRWRAVGADRYLLRFETSNPELFDAIHPPTEGRTRDRIAMLREMRELGYEIGSGVMIGIPGQSYDDLANDILLFAELDLDMIGVGPYIAHPSSALWKNRPIELSEEDQVPSEELMVYKVMALTRIACPEANIPSTSALATINLEEGRELGLMRGANIVMPNLTPTEYRRYYEIYPNKACIDDDADQCHACMNGRIRKIGRLPGNGPGGRQHGPVKDQSTESNDPFVVIENNQMK